MYQAPTFVLLSADRSTEGIRPSARTQPQAGRDDRIRRRRPRRPRGPRAGGPVRRGLPRGLRERQDHQGGPPGSIQRRTATRNSTPRISPRRSRAILRRSNRRLPTCCATATPPGGWMLSSTTPTPCGCRRSPCRSSATAGPASATRRTGRGQAADRADPGPAGRGVQVPDRHVDPFGGKLLKTYWLVQGVRAELPLGAVRELAASSDVSYVELSDGAPAGGRQPGQRPDRRAGADLQRPVLQPGPDGRLDRSARLRRARPRTRVFNAPDHIAVAQDLSGDGDPTDQCNHGTASASRSPAMPTWARTGVASRRSPWTPSTSTATTAWSAAPARWRLRGGGELAGQGDRGGDPAERRRDQRVVNRGGQRLRHRFGGHRGQRKLRSGCRHRALPRQRAQGDRHRRRRPDLRRVDGVLRSRTTADGRYKPDLVFPTNIETARSGSNVAMGSFGGTSAATPVAGGAAALLRNWMRGGVGSIDAGHVYSHLILGGQTTWPFDNNTGAGPFRLGTGGTPGGARSTWPTAARWTSRSRWRPARRSSRVRCGGPRRQAGTTMSTSRWSRPDGTVRDISISGVSVFERAGVSARLPGHLETAHHRLLGNRRPNRSGPPAPARRCRLSRPPSPSGAAVGTRQVRRTSGGRRAPRVAGDVAITITEPGMMRESSACRTSSSHSSATSAK